MYIRMHARSIYYTIALISMAFSSGFSRAGVLFQDSFESGDVSHNSNGVKWFQYDRYADPVVSTKKPHTGNYSLEFAYPGDGPSNPDTPDSWKEQRFSLGGHYTELWIKFNLFIPGNYYNRDKSNNKFMYLETGANPGTFIGFESWGTGTGYYSGLGSGSSYIPLHLSYGGVDRGHLHEGQLVPYVDTNTDRNKWHEWIVHAKLASSASSNDGAVEVWKDGKKWIEYLNLPNYTSGGNYLAKGYLLGWANTGFDTTTTLYIDDVVISTSPILPSGDSGSTTKDSSIAAPLAPSNIK